MSPDKLEPPTAAEWKILKAVFERGSCAARDVIDAADAEHGWSASTVKTLLRRLVEKGHLKTTQVGNCFLYEPVRTRLSTLCAAAQPPDDLHDLPLGGCQGRGTIRAHRASRSSGWDQSVRR